MWSVQILPLVSTKSGTSGAKHDATLTNGAPRPEGGGALSPAPEAVRRPGRVLGFDVVRAFAAIAVVWDHSGRSDVWNANNMTAVGGWGTAFLNTLAGFFVVYTLKNYGVHGAHRFAFHRIFRLYVPFLIWSLIYVGARFVNLWLFHKKTDLEWSPVLFLIGTTYHLWFLPYLLIVTLLTVPFIAIAMRDRNSMVFGSAAFVLLATALIVVPEPSWVRYDNIPMLPLVHLYLRAPGYLFGVAIGLWMLAGFGAKVSALEAAACAALVAVLMYMAQSTELPRHMIYRIAATAAFLITLAPWRGRIATAIGSLGRLGFGVYLCHVLFVEGLVQLYARLGMAKSIPKDLLVFFSAVVLSFAFSYAMRRVRWLSWLIP